MSGKIFYDVVQEHNRTQISVTMNIYGENVHEEKMRKRKNEETIEKICEEGEVNNEQLALLQVGGLACVSINNMLLV